MTEPTQQSTDVRHALGWAAFLGTSWTWVIGMFLPVFLIRDFGPAAWFVFAIPNVLGAAAMGWMIRSREHSERFVANHRAAGQAFSLVTIAFHVYVMMWLVPKLIGPLPAAIALGAAMIVLAPVLATRLAATTLAIVTLLASALIAVVLLGLGALSLPVAANAQAPFDLVSLAVVCTLGFLTCPYLDLTFHRASQASRTPGESRIAFGVGFGICFCSMIVLTLLYANVLLHAVGGGAAQAIVGIHLCLQAIFTMGMHAASYRRVTVQPLAASRALIGAVVIPVALALAARWMENHDLTVGPLPAGEIGYRTFMAFYGLVAPAYVWICVRRADEPPQPFAIRNAIASAVIAAPFFWVGFMHGSMRWSLPGVGALVAGWIVTATMRTNAAARERGFKALGGHLR